MRFDARPYLFALLAALLLALPTVLNGSAFFYEDSIGYVGKAVGPARALGFRLRAGDDWLDAAHRREARPPATARATPVAAAAHAASGPPRYWIAGRSIVYGLTTYLLYAAGGFLLVALFQALVLAVPLALLWMRCLARPGRDLLAAAGLLAVASSAGLFAGLVMPDYAAAPVVLVPALLFAFPRKLGRVDHAVLVILLAYAAMLHDSHIVVLAGLAALGLAVAPVARRRGQAVAWPWGAAFAVVAALGMGQAYAAVARHATGQPLMRLPHLTAHFAESAILTGYLARTCPGNGFALCAYRGRLPTAWTTFLFGPDLFAAADYPTQRRISGQQVPLLIAMARDRPAAVTGFLARDAVRQVALFGYADLDQARKLPFFAAMPQAVVNCIAASMVVRHEGLLRAQDMLQRALVVLSLPALALMVARAARGGGAEGRTWCLFAAFVLSGVALNGLACGVLAFPYDRFQARVIWLVPMLALSGIVFVRRRFPAASLSGVKA